MNHFDRASVAHNTQDRVAIASEKDCPSELLRSFILNDTEIDVVVAAAQNPNCPEELIPKNSSILGLHMSLLVAHYSRVQICSTLPTWDRMDLARDENSPSELLKVIIEYDLDSNIILAAAANRNCPIDMLSVAAEKTGVRLSLLLAQNNNNRNFDTIDPGINRDQFILSHIMDRDSQVTELTQQQQFRTQPKDPSLPIKGHIVLIMCPSWGTAFAPYNIAKLASLLRWQNYKVTVFDMNIKAFHLLKDKTEFNYWESGRHHLWYDEDFKTKILPLLNDYINDVVEEILHLNPDVVGLSLYATNIWCSKYLLRLLKALKPTMPIIVGGPEASQHPELEIFEKGLIDYVFVGEAEELLSDFLERKQYLIPAEKEVLGGFNSRLNLDDWPAPDYSDYNLSEYDRGAGCSMETSRGCTAQCSFCGEYQLWKYRSRSAQGIVDELKMQKEKYGISSVWFVDSLINGNLAAFKEMVDKMIEADLNISWNVYSRCNGKMDRAFADKVVKAGCSCLSWGVEHGSQKVLDDMRKKIDVWEIEQNLKDFHEAGVANHVNYLIGFPTEDNLDFLHGITVIWNTGRWIASISPGMGCGAPPNSDLALEWQKYGYVGDNSCYDRTFLGTWYTKNYKNTMLHRIIRIKSVAILLEIMHKNFDMIDVNGHRYSDVDKFYSFSFDKKNTTLNFYVHQINNLNLNIFESQTENDEFATSIANEYTAIAYLLYHILQNDFELEIYFNPAVDYVNFGSFNAVNYTATIKIKANAVGDFTINIDHTLNHEALSIRWKEQVDRERENERDMSFTETRSYRGNFNDLLTETSQVGVSVHQQYQKSREKQKSIKLSLIT